MESGAKEESPESEVASALLSRLEQYRRIILLGNSGGAIAALSFLGSSLATDGMTPLLRPMWWCLLAFIVGIAMCLMDRVSEIQALAQRLKLPHHLMTRAVNDFPKNKSDDWEATLDETLTPKVWSVIRTVRAAYNLQLVLLSISSICSTLGVTAGMSILWVLTIS